MHNKIENQHRKVTQPLGSSAIAKAHHELVSRPAAATYLGVQPHTLATWASTKRYALPYVKVGRLVKYRRADLDAFIQENVQG